MEAQKGLPVSFLCDRHTTKVSVVPIPNKEPLTWRRMVVYLTHPYTNAGQQISSRFPQIHDFSVFLKFLRIPEIIWQKRIG